MVEAERHLGLFQATVVGVGAIVGGGILALAGVAFGAAGPAAMIAFAANGVIALLTAASFAELARRFPESGGTYTYAKKLLPIEIAYVVGWIVWFASIVAAVLYALGFAAFASEGLRRLATTWNVDLSWLGGSAALLTLACAATLFYALALVRRSGGGDSFATVGKVVVFCALIVGGAVACWRQPSAEWMSRLDPFTPEGAISVVQAMGFTFIALQGFDLIAAIGGEVRDPRRNLPRAMYLSLAIALLIYLPLLFVIATVGSDDRGVLAAAQENSEGFVATAAERFLGSPGYWLVIGAGLLSMLSALQANLLGASRVAFAMARDRTLPRSLGRLRAGSGSPAFAVVVTATMVLLVVLAVGEVSAAGAASSLIFLLSFATVHWAVVLLRRRSGQSFPWVAGVGLVCCIGLALFQAFVVPSAGIVVTAWLAIGLVFYLTMLAPGARLADVSAIATDPELSSLRGRSPLTLVPIANPASARRLTAFARRLETPGGRTLLLSVVPTAAHDERDRVADAESILGASLSQSLEAGGEVETLFSVAPEPWTEIRRVAEEHQCETVVVGLPKLTAAGVEDRLDALLVGLRSHAVVLRAPQDWHVSTVERVLVPIGGRRDQSYLRTRLLASLRRERDVRLRYLLVLPTKAAEEEQAEAEAEVARLGRDESSGAFEVVVVRRDDVAAAILEEAQQCDLVVLGSPRGSGSMLTKLSRQVAQETDIPMVLIRSRRYALRRV